MCNALYLPTKEVNMKQTKTIDLGYFNIAKERIGNR